MPVVLSQRLYRSPERLYRWLLELSCLDRAVVPLPPGGGTATRLSKDQRRCSGHAPPKYRSSLYFDAVLGRWWPGWSGCSSSTGTTGGPSGSSAKILAAQALKAMRLHRPGTARLPHSGVTPFCSYAVVERWLGGCSGCSSQPVLPPGRPVVPPGRVLHIYCESRLYRDQER